MSAADQYLTLHSAEFIKQYNENAGLAVVKPWHGGNCCIGSIGYEYTSEDDREMSVCGSPSESHWFRNIICYLLIMQA